MSLSADVYSVYAAQCIALADRVSDPADKARLLLMAQTFRDLALRQKSDNEPTA